MIKNLKTRFKSTLEKILLKLYCYIVGGDYNFLSVYIEKFKTVKIPEGYQMAKIGKVVPTGKYFFFSEVAKKWVEHENKHSSLKFGGSDYISVLPEFNEGFSEEK